MSGSAPSKGLGRYATVFVALVIVVGFGWMARFPVTSKEQAAELAARFRFARQPMPEVANHPAYKHVREVHQSLKRIASWISSLGAAVTLSDLDGDGLPNDIIHVDPRTDVVTVAPAPGTGNRYVPFALRPDPLPFNPKTTAPMGALAGDFNEDGRRDVLVYFWGRTPVVYLRKESSEALGATAYEPVELTGSGERWFSNGAIQADLDGDGHVDILIGNYFQDGAHILDASASGTEVLHEGKSKALNGGRKHVFLWKGGSGGGKPTVQFEEIAGVFDEAVTHGWTLAMGAADLDGDLLPELYFGHDFGPDRLLHNRSRPGKLSFAVLEGKRTFLTPKSCTLNNDSFKGMGCDFGDVNGDGYLDIYVSNIATKFGLTESHFLWLSTGRPELMQQNVAPYVNASEKLGLSRSGWGWDSRLADFDNDGVLEAVQGCGFIKGKINRWPELQALGTSNDQVVHNPKFWPNFKPGADLSGHDSNPFFVRGTDGRYHDIAPELGLDEPMVTKGIATADVDGDGRLDFAVANQWGPSYFFHNDAPKAGEFIGLHLLLPLGAAGNLVERPGHPGTDTIGRPAIGAVARAILPDGRKLVAQVDASAGHSGRRSPDIQFGLGAVDAKQPISVELQWRDGRGEKREVTLRLKPGWHTLLLGRTDANLQTAAATTSQP